MKLFIIGNGFDLAHGIKSRYWDFGEYLQKNYPGFYNDLMAAINYYDGIWSDFEGDLPMCATEMESFGLQVSQERLEELDYDPMNDEGMGQWMNEKLVFINQLPEVLREWIQSVDIKKKKVYRSDLFSEEDLFLSFNYTSTLEGLYKIPAEKILHIHGSVANWHEDLIMGHRSTQQIESTTRDYNNAVSEFSDGASAVFQCVLEFLEKTYKDTSMIIEKNEDFFNSIYGNNIEEVVVIGSSLSNIDRPYFERIRDEGDLKWYIYYHDSGNTIISEKEKAKAMKFLETLQIPEEKRNVVSSLQILINSGKI